MLYEDARPFRRLLRERLAGLEWLRTDREISALF